jgi:L-lactate dehydrogenase complex protein LldF
MEIRSMHFRANVSEKLADPVLQANLRQAKNKFVDARAKALTELDDVEATRDAAQGIRDRVLKDLDVWLETFERNAQASGATVLWAQDGAEVCRHVVEIAHRHGVRKAIKSKSMLSEEADLNRVLAAAGVQPVETDLGEYILQINDNEPPSHIIAPVMHKSAGEVADLFAKVHGTPRKDSIPALTREAREVLREHFVSADMGISGANFLVAETGSAALVTNEGNGRMVTTLPRVHVVITGIEKVVPTLEDLSTLMRLLPRSASGQSISNYFSVLTGTRHEGDLDGPDHLYFVLVDGGRAGLVGGELQPVLRCIRCGACMNHCPVYQTIGGQAYGWVYSGPVGSVLTPMFVGIDKALDLPQAATMCKQCEVVCPVRIPLPELLRKLRDVQSRSGLRSFSERLALRVWHWLSMHPTWYAAATTLGARYLKWLAGGKAAIPVLGPAPEWTLARDFPAPTGKTFRELYAARRGGSDRATAT